MLKTSRVRQRVLVGNVERIGRYLIRRDRKENATVVDGKSVRGPAPFELESVRFEDETDEEEPEEPESVDDEPELE
jgi:hypothetical protein